VLSWIILRGKCRDCGNPISRRYPLVELATAIAFVGVAAWAGHPETDLGKFPVYLVPLIAFLYLLSISIALTLIDLETFTLPSKIILPAYVVGAVLLTVSSALDGSWHRLLTAAIGCASLFAMYLLMVLIYPGGMGFGDVRLSGVLGMFLGWVGPGPLAVGAFAPFLLGGLFAIVLMLLKKAGKKSKIPFGPWMLIGAWVGIVSGERLASWYLGLFGLVG